MIRYALRLFILVLFCLLFTFACTYNSFFKGEGTLKGKISIGPLCPVETIPPNPACQPTAETYKAWATAVWTLNHSAKVATLNPNLDGNYEIQISSGNYIIDFDQRINNHVGGSNLPAFITVAFGDTTNFNINIDTGIR